MQVFKSIIIAISMFSKIPVPTLEWDEKSMKYAIAAFPLIGVFVGGLCILWNRLMFQLEFSNVVTSIGLLLIPILVTGGIHLDGLCDTADALSSRAPRERKLQILKDPHIGAFGVINLVVYLIAYFAFIFELPKSARMVACFAFSLVLSRVLSGLSIIVFRSSSDSESSIGSTFSNLASKKTCVALLIIVGLAASFFMIYYGSFPGIVAIFLVFITFIIYKLYIIRQFGGVSGDLAGWLVQMCELMSLIGIVIASHVIEVLI